jgi:hypothetical protein
MTERMATLALLLALAAAGNAADDEGAAVYAEAKRFTFNVCEDPRWNADNRIFELDRWRE